MSRNCPEYTDGYFDLYRIKESEESDFPEQYYEDTGLHGIWYKELSVFDKLRYTLDEQGKEVTMKIVIPQYRGIDSHCACLINGVFHQVYNAAHIISKTGFPETELTLIRPENNREVLDAAD